MPSDGLIRRRGTRTFGLGLAALLLLSACGSTAGGTPSAQKVVIGLSDPLSGSAAVYAEIGQGMNAYFQYATADNLVPGYAIDGMVVDNQGTVAGGSSTVRQLLASKPIAIEVTTTAAFSGALSVLRTNQTPVFAVSDGAVVKDSNLPSAFGLWTDYTQESFFDIKYLISQLHLQRLAIVYDPAVNEPAGQQDPGYITGLGGTVAADIAVPASTTNYAPVVQQLQASNAQGVVFMTLIPATAGIAAQMASVGYTPTLIAYSGNMSASLASAGGQAVNGIYVDNWFPPLSATSSDMSLFKAEVTKYAGSKAFNTLGEAGWIGGSVIVAGIKAAVAGGKPLTTTSFEQGLYSLNGKTVGLIVVDYTNAAHYAVAGESSMTMYRLSGTDFSPVK